jgi:Protein of unknown function (DUF1573)
MKKIGCTKRYLAFALLAAVTLSFPMRVRLAEALDDPATGTTYDFGAVKQGETVTHTFYVKNVLVVPLKIARIDLPAPGMTVRAKPMIDPGTNGEIEIAWNTARVVGSVTAKATVRFVEAQRPDLTLVLSGTVTPAIEAIPLAGFFISLFKDESAERSITLVNHQDHALGIRKLDAQNPLFQASLDTRTVGQVYELAVKVPAGIRPGRYAEEIRLETDDQKFPTIQIPVNLLVKDDLYVTPDVVDFGEIDLSRLTAQPNLLQLLAHTIIVKKRAGKFEIKSIVSGLPELRITRTPDDASQSFELRVALELQALRPGAFSGTIRVLTTDMALPQLAIPVRGQVK